MILIPAPTYLPARRANTVQVMKMAQALAQIGERVRVLVPAPPTHTQDPTWEMLAEHYGLETQFDVEWTRAKPRWRSYDFGWWAARLAQRNRVKWMYTRHPQAAAFASLRGIPTILEVHDMPQGTAGPPLMRMFLRGRGGQRVITITQALADDLAAAYALPQTLVLPDGVDWARYANLPDIVEARAQLPVPLDGFVAGYTGHLYPGRGVETLFALAQTRPHITFLVVGGNPSDVEDARRRAESSGLSNLILTGFVPNAALPRYQAACDVLLMPYQRQVAASSGGDIGRYLSPMKLFEYLACGRPILASALPVFGEVLNDRNAILLPPDEVTAWAATLDAFVVDPVRRHALGTQARTDAQKYTWQARARRLLSG
jgi:glycosyltransferase involved in cell wall biosynthesis